MNTGIKERPAQLGDIPRLQELDIQRTLLPMSHSSVSISSANANNGADSSTPPINLRSYVPLSRSSVVGGVSNGKTNNAADPVSRTDYSTLSGY